MFGSNYSTNKPMDKQNSKTSTLNWADLLFNQFNSDIVIYEEKNTLSEQY